jgi:hypothetical protein
MPAEVSPSDLRIRRVQSKAPREIHWAWDRRRWFSILRICTCWRHRMPDTRIADRATTSNALIMATPVCFFGVATAVGCFSAALAFPCFLVGLLASPLCGAALTFFAAAKKVSKESGLTPPARRCPPRKPSRSGPKTRPALAFPPFVTKHSFIPSTHCVRDGSA